MTAFNRSYVLLPSYLIASGIDDPSRIGWLMGIFYLSTFARPFVSWFIDWKGFKIVLLSSGILSILTATGILVTDPGSFVSLFIWRILAGTAFSFIAVVLTAYQTLGITGRFRGTSFSVVAATTNLPFFLVIPFCEVLIKYGYQQIYLMMPILFGSGICVFSLFLPPLDVEYKRPKISFWRNFSVVMDSQIRMLLFSVSLFCSVDAGLLSLVALGNEKGTTVSVFFVAFAVTSVLIRYFGSPLVDYFPRIRTGWLCGALGGISIAIFAFPAVNNTFAFVVIGAIYGVSNGLGYPIFLTLISDVAPPEHRSQVAALFWFFMGLAYLLMPVI
ncbi:MAG: MFS transporter, partial [Bacteroidales bacterium]|nr:MFS transporter [Bacteroidales bacterium]